MPEPICYCPDCGKPMTLNEEPISKMFRDLYVFAARCENGHRYELIQDLQDGGRTRLTQMLDADNGDSEDHEEDELAGPENEIAQEWN